METKPSSSSNVIDADAVIVGAGPVGLFQVFELGLLEIKAHVIDSLPVVGGQCVELYPDKPIYDIPAVPVCTGQELTDNLLKQIEPFEPTFHLNQEVTLVQRREDGRFDLETSAGTRFITKTIFIAAGVGSFQPRTLKVEGIDAFEDKQVFYRVKNPSQFEGKNLVICGGGDSALDWALALAGKAESVVLIHRREDFRAAPASVAKMKEMCDNYEMQFIIGQVTGIEVKDDKLSELKVVNTEKFETNVPGIFAVGDINTYPGKKKLILSGFHEAALAAFGAAPYIFPDKKIHMQYTTTSPKLHKILGVESPVFD
jgi:thioredoxin reductase (NADPH)